MTGGIDSSPIITTGSLLTIVHSERHVRCYTVQANELKILTATNDKAAAFFSAAASFATLCASILISASFADMSQNVAKVVTYAGAPLTAFIGIVFLALAVMERRSRSSMIQD